MNNSENITSFFQESEYGFMVFVVEQRFAVGRGAEYFRSFKGKENLIDTNRKMRKRISNILKWIQKNVPNIATMMEGIYGYTNPIDIASIISAFSKLFAIEEHQAAGPEVIDPIIIQEGTVLPKYLNQMIALHKSSILRPAIIILLKDNDFERAKAILSGCPNGCYLKLIRNSGDCEIHRVVNTGADDIESFLDAFAMQCFSTCSKTKHDILMNKEWAGNSIVKKYSPLLLKIRTNLLFDEKNEITDTLNNLVTELVANLPTSNNENRLIRSFECMARLNQVYCQDYGGENLKTALKLAKYVDNDILLAHVYRYARLMDNISKTDSDNFLETAQKIFQSHHMEDHALYCWNNRLVAQFYTDKINLREFSAMQEEAIYNVPGLVGMSHLLNNTGVAHLVTGNPDEAFEYFEKALQYARDPNRIVQKIAIFCNIIIAKAYCFQKIDEAELRKTMNLIFDGMRERLPFISARYVMNIISVAFMQSPTIGRTLLSEYPVENLINKGLLSNRMGSSQLLLQMGVLANRYPDFTLNQTCITPPEIDFVSGIRREFIIRYGLNPFFFSTWL